MINKKNPKRVLIVLTILMFSLFTITTKAQGPNAPEAASFEPVDASDMVNLVTGDLSYVLPLLNVPSPEGGYPISLSYHAGIAMDQEATWVGLGWSLNPGSINRGVNGYPDDWGKTNVNEFFYDTGWTDDYYGFSAGVTISDAVSVGLGLSWGSNQSLGGYVYANIGFEKQGFGVGFSAGTNGASINGGIKGFSASVGTNGVGVGYGFSNKGGTSLGISLNYNYNSGLSGGVSIAQSGKFGYSSGKGYSNSASASLGINFSTSGVSLNGRAGGAGIGVSLSTNGITEGDYHVDVASGGFEISTHVFSIKYSHDHVSYSLYKYNNLFTSGILNPVLANESMPYKDNTGLSKLLSENNFMDVNVLPKYDYDMEVASLIDNLDKVDKNNLVLPNYDNYTVTAQGISGTLKPYIHSEINLSGRGRGEQNEDDVYQAYLNHSVAEYNSSGNINVNTDATRKVNFTFDNAYNSFLRMERSDIVQHDGLPSVHADHIMDYFGTNPSLNFNNDNSLHANKKREGSYIETFTNKQIRDSYTSPGSISSLLNFIDAKQYDSQNNEINIDRSDTDVFLDNGIGAYQITTQDGRTYHYSLPVYNFESFYKNFKNENDENENFFEIQKTTPYATHWLLTGITGPDYIDNNNNGTLDEGDYGYWVVFDYGKWSDGYIWQTPNGHYKVDEDERENKTYSYAWGRKQIYYLDAIKTRTHTALFVKDLREDNVSSIAANTWEQEWVSGNFDFSTNPKILSSQDLFKVFAKPGDTYYEEDGTQIDLPAGDGQGKWVREYVGRHNTTKYINAPESKSLKLSKIILLKRENATHNKIFGNLTPILNGNIYTNNYVDYIKGYYYGYPRTDGYNPGTVYSKPNNIIGFQTNIHSNVLDIKDIEGLNLEGNAQQVIEFNHDYGLAPNTSNSNAEGNGRLTLNSVNYQGKGGVQMVPPYRFYYENSLHPFNQDNIDEWGYRKSNPDYVWSLSEIYTPTGGRIKIDYEEDSYYAEAASYETKYFEDVTLAAAAIPGITIDVTLNNATNITDYFKTGRNIMFTFTRKTLTNTGQGGYQELNPVEFTTPLQVNNISGNTLHLIPTSETEGITLSDVASMCVNAGSYCYRDLKIKNNKFPLYTVSNPNGKQGGGIRTKSIAISNGGLDIAKSEYVYTNPTTNKISGITSYAPSDDPKGIPYVSELPPPMVTYEYVRMVNKDGNDNLLGSTQYRFGVLEPFHEESGFIYSLGDTFKVKENQNTTFENGSVLANKYTIHNCLGNVGRLLTVTTLNSKNQVLSKKDNHYKTDLDNDDEIGVTQESHKSYKRIVKDDVESFAVSSTSKVNYPSVLESTSTTQGGFTATTYFYKHDFLTGQVLETRTIDSKGAEFKTELIPAYTISDYSGDLNNNGIPDDYGMGSKVDDETNYNMLTQEAMTKTYIKIGGNWEETGVGITTWNNDWTYVDYDGDTDHETAANKKIWRKHKTFVWDGSLNTNGTLNGFTGEDDSFVWDVGSSIAQTNSEWKNVSTTTQYDHYSTPLELKDINDNYAATKMCDDNSKVLAVSNAAYGEMYYSGAEHFADTGQTYFDGQVRSSSGGRLSGSQLGTPHTGNYFVTVSQNQIAFEVTLPQNNARTGVKSKFKVSVWVPIGQEDNAKIRIGSQNFDFEESEEVSAGGWTMLNGYITIPIGETIVGITSIGSTLHLDDFRLYPATSSMTSYVYNEWDELWYIIGNNGLASKFEYDAAGRLIKSYTEVIDDGTLVGGFKVISENRYNNKFYNN